MTSTNFINKKQRAHKILALAALVVTLVFPLGIILFGNASHIDSAQSFCPFKMLTGFPCPGCGITKSLVHLYEGDILASLAYHVIGIPLVLFCTVLIWVLSIELLLNRKLNLPLLYSRKLAYGLALFLIGYHIIRLAIFVHEHDLNGILNESIWR